jgi:tripartite-type tricarboxylate transporter receptor subunit TctC
MANAALSQDYPSRPIRIIVPFPAGGTADLLARQIGQIMSEALRQQVLIENRAGAGGNIGADLAAFMQAESAKWGKIVRESGARVD